MEIYRSRSDVGKRDVGRGGILCGPCRVTRRVFESVRFFLDSATGHLLPLVIHSKSSLQDGAHRGYGKEWRLNKTR